MTSSTTTSFLLPQANLKAKDLPNDYLPNPQILKAYRDAKQDFDFDSDASIHDRVYRWFWAMVNGNVRTKEQKLEQQISQVYRVKNNNSEGEFLMYHIALFGLNHKGEPVDFSDLVGRIDQIPIFQKTVDEHTGEVVTGPLKHNHKTVYSIPFTKEKVDELSKYFTDNVSFAIKGLGTAGKTYSCSFDQFRNMEWNELVRAQTSYMHSDYYKLKQLMEAQQNQGGVTTK